MKQNNKPNNAVEVENKLLAIFIEHPEYAQRFFQEDGGTLEMLTFPRTTIVEALQERIKSNDNDKLTRLAVIKYAGELHKKKELSKKEVSAVEAAFNAITIGAAGLDPNDYPTYRDKLKENAGCSELLEKAKEWRKARKDGRLDENEYTKLQQHIIKARNDGTSGERELADKLDEYIRPFIQTTEDYSKETQAAASKLKAGNYEPSDMGNAQLFADIFKEQIKYVSEWKQFLYWDGKRWNSDNGNAAAHRLAKKLVRYAMPIIAQGKSDDKRVKYLKWMATSQSLKTRENMLKDAQSSELLSISANQLDVDPWLFNCESGTIDLKSGTHREHRANDLITKISPVEYDPNATAPTWKAFLNRIFSDPINGEPRTELIEFMKRSLGYTLTGSVGAQVFWVLHGTGANGKTTMMDAVSHMIGDYGIAAQQSLLINDKNKSNGEDEANLFGKRFAVASETDDGAKFNVSKLKRLTGGNIIRARRLYQDSFQFAATHKLFLDCNHKPKVKGRDYAFERRIMMVPFDIVIPSQERDSKLSERLQAEAAGILNWMLDGLKQYNANGLQPPKIVMDTVNDYMLDNDLLGQFLEEKTQDNPIGRATSDDLYLVYSSWCDSNGLDHKLTKIMLGKKLKERGYEKGKSNDSRFHTGLELLKVNEEDDAWAL